MAEKVLAKQFLIAASRLCSQWFVAAVVTRVQSHPQAARALAPLLNLSLRPHTPTLRALGLCCAAGCVGCITSRCSRAYARSAQRATLVTYV